MPEEFIEYVPDFRFELLDVRDQHSWDLDGLNRLILSLMHVLQLPLKDRSGAVLKLLNDSGWLSVPEALLISVHAYALRLIPAVDINSLIEQIISQKEDTETMSKFVSMAEGLVRKGRREGRREGRKVGWSEGMQQGRDAGMQQGFVEGKRQTLLTILQKRFGTVSPELQARIATADSDVLGNWTLRALEINSIEELG